MIDEVITMLDIKLLRWAAFKHTINTITPLSITPEIKLEESKKVTLMSENSMCNKENSQQDNNEKKIYKRGGESNL